MYSKLTKEGCVYGYPQYSNLLFAGAQWFSNDFISTVKYHEAHPEATEDSIPLFFVTGAQYYLTVVSNPSCLQSNDTMMIGSIVKDMSGDFWCVCYTERILTDKESSDLSFNDLSRVTSLKEVRQRFDDFLDHHR